MPHRFSGSRGLYQQPEVRSCLAFLRVLADPDDDLSLFEVLTGEVYRTPLSDLKVLLNHASRRHRPLRALVRSEDLGRGSEETELDSEARAAAERALDDLARYESLARERSVAEVLYSWLEKSGVLRSLASGPAEEGERRLGNLARFFERVKEYDRQGAPGELVRIVGYLDDLIAEGDDPAAWEAGLDEDCVAVSTVHGAKGLEWPVVFLASLEEGHFPGHARREGLALPSSLFPGAPDPGLAHRAEERRLFYVGLTRAKAECRLSHSRDHGGRKAWKRSSFLQEALDLPKEEPVPKGLSSGQRLARHAPLPDPVLPGLAQPVPPGTHLKLSYYRIDDYLTCPAKYKFIHVLGLKAPLSHPIVYGQAMHHAVQCYHKARMEGLPFGLGDLKAAFREGWRAEGFHSREHEDERFSHGEARLEAFYQEQEGEGGVPLWVEKPFSASLNGDDLLAGQMDRVDRDADGKVLVCDYKTSNIHEQDKADDEVRKSLQLAIYALGYRDLEGRLPDTLRLHFLESGLKADLKPDEAFMRDKTAQIGKAFAGIRAAAFDATPEYMACRQCAFHAMCPASVFE